MAYGNPCTFHVDPVEKKPLFHFLPGTPTFSLATSGCVFRCLNCQNWEISQKKPEETKDPARAGAAAAPAAAADRSASTNSARLSLFPDDVGRRRRGAALPVDLLHLLRADRLLRIRLRHLQARPRARAEEHHRDLRLDRGPAAPRPRPVRGRRARGPQGLRRRRPITGSTPASCSRSSTRSRPTTSSACGSR